MEDYQDIETNKFLGIISSDFVKISETLENTAYELIKRDFDYPIFIVSKHELKGIPVLIPKDELDNKWVYHVTFLSMLVEKKIILDDKFFKAQYKDPDKYACLLIIDPDFTKIVFMPYADDK